MKMLKKLPRRAMLVWALVFAWTVVMFLLSLQKKTDSSKLSEPLVKFIIQLLPPLKSHRVILRKIVRKSAHFCMFALEGALIGTALSFSVRGSRRRVLLWGICICVPMAVLNELSQLAALGRSCEALDMLIDASGATAGLCVVCAFLSILRHFKNKRQNGDVTTK